jgi:hypothetical protein
MKYQINRGTMNLSYSNNPKLNTVVNFIFFFESSVNLWRTYHINRGFESEINWIEGLASWIIEEEYDDFEDFGLRFETERGLRFNAEGKRFNNLRLRLTWFNEEDLGFQGRDIIFVEGFVFLLVFGIFVLDGFQIGGKWKWVLKLGFRVWFQYWRIWFQYWRIVALITGGPYALLTDS